MLGKALEALTIWSDHVVCFGEEVMSLEKYRESGIDPTW